PAFAYTLVLSSAIARATISPSPASVRWTKRKLSAVPQISLPAPAIVNRPLLSVVVPPVAPMSSEVHPVGGGGGAGLIEYWRRSARWSEGKPSKQVLAPRMLAAVAVAPLPVWANQ